MSLIGGVRCLLALAPLLASAPLAAQIQQDTIPPDTLVQDTGNNTENYLQVQEAIRVRLPVLPYIGADGPRAPLSRIVLERDSIDWALAETLGDLLQQVPGVYLWRAGWLGRQPSLVREQLSQRHI